MGLFFCLFFVGGAGRGDIFVSLEVTPFSYTAWRKWKRLLFSRHLLLVHIKPEKTKVVPSGMVVLTLHRIAEIGRDLWRFFKAKPQHNRVTYRGLLSTVSSHVLKISTDRDYKMLWATYSTATTTIHVYIYIISVKCLVFRVVPILSLDNSQTQWLYSLKSIR